MTITRRHYLSAIASLSIAPMSLHAQAQISTAVAINRAGRYRALSQRSAKLYTQQLLGVLPQQAASAIATAQRLVQLSNDDLAKAQLQGEAAAQYRTVVQEAAALNTLMAEAPSREQVLKVNSQAEKLLVAADTLTRQIEQSSKQESAGVLNQAGRQRMLSQRLAKNYFLAAAGLETPASKQQLVTDRADFNKAMQTLAAATVNTAGIKSDLEIARAQWLFFEAQITKPADPAGLQTVATTSERILDMMNELANKYEVALRDQLGRV